jgi:hypothetical protein
MTTTANQLDKMGDRAKILYDAAYDLLFCVKSIIVAKDVLYIIRDVK